jgi:hypothetical protein
VDSAKVRVLCIASAVIGQVASPFSDMQKTVERALLPAWIELLVRERNKGKSLRQLGRMCGRSLEAVRQLLAKYDRSQESLLPEAKVVAKLGYPREWLVQLKKEGLINPIRRRGWWFYSEEQVRQIPLLIAEMRRCERCGKLRPSGYRRFCRNCSRHGKY